MSFGGGNGGYQGGRTRMGTKVFLNLYDLSPANDFLYPIGFGLHHSGVEVLGSEYSFASNAGIFEASPKEAPGAKFREQLLIGIMDGGQSELKKALDDLRDLFGPNDYNIIKRNCNHFANALVGKLVPGKQAPGYVNRIADVGACCACLLPRQMLENAPVGDPDASNNTAGGSSGFLARSPNAPQTNSMRAFTGTGSRLGGPSSSSSSTAEESEGSSLVGSLLGKVGSVAGGVVGGGSSSSSNPKTEDSLTDRREKARKAALARLEKQQPYATSNESKDK